MLVHEIVAARRQEIRELCAGLPLRGLDLIGSGVGDSFDAAASDVDVFAEFDETRVFDRFEAYFDLKEGLERILERPVDVVTPSGLRNPHLRKAILETREALYRSES